ncbi:hypothetical protein PGB90_007584 [Kerria lacca]
MPSAPMKYEVEFLLQQQWQDPRLSYGNQSKYEYLNGIHHQEDVWLPDTYFIMHGDFKTPIIPVHFALKVYRNGTIVYYTRRHLILSCQGSISVFPFDDPLCSFAMESISYEQSAIEYVWKNDEATLRKSPSLKTLNAYLIKNQTITCKLESWRGNYSCLKVELMFTRDRVFYFTTVFIPGIILVTSSFITFWLEWNAVPARVMIAVKRRLFLVDYNDEIFPIIGQSRNGLLKLLYVVVDVKDIINLPLVPTPIYLLI